MSSWRHPEAPTRHPGLTSEDSESHVGATPPQEQPEAQPPIAPRSFFRLVFCYTFAEYINGAEVLFSVIRCQVEIFN